MSAYLKFYELEKSPFDTESQTNLVLGTRALRSAFAQIEEGLQEGAPRICVSGKGGMGKTSLARALPKLLDDQARVVLLLNPSLSWRTLRTAIIRQLDLDGGMLSRQALAAAATNQRRLVLVIDQAERISQESLEHLDILLGYRTDDDRQLVHCILLSNLEQAGSAGDCPLLWWLDSLNTLQLEFAPIPATGVESYIDKHLKRAGWKGGHLFTADAALAIHRLSGGVPRSISALCERVLADAAKRGIKLIEATDVEAISSEGELGGSAGGGAPTADSPTKRRDPRAEPELPPDQAQAPEARPSSRGSEKHEASPNRQTERLSTGSMRKAARRGRSILRSVRAPVSIDSYFAGDREDSDSDDRVYSVPRMSRPEGRSPVRWIAIGAAVLMLGGGGFYAITSLTDDDTTGEGQTAARAPTSATPAAPVAESKRVVAGEMEKTPPLTEAPPSLSAETVTPDRTQTPLEVSESAPQSTSQQAAPPAVPQLAAKPATQPGALEEQVAEEAQQPQQDARLRAVRDARVPEDTVVADQAPVRVPEQVTPPAPAAPARVAPAAASPLMSITSSPGAGARAGKAAIRQRRLREPAARKAAPATETAPAAPAEPPTGELEPAWPTDETVDERYW